MLSRLCIEPLSLKKNSLGLLRPLRFALGFRLTAPLAMTKKGHASQQYRGKGIEF